jgi:hypothetical protein
MTLTVESNFERLVIEIRTEPDHPIISKAFWGAWLTDNLTTEDESWNGSLTFALARTSKGQLAVYETSGLDADGSLSDSATAKLEVRADFAAIRSGDYPEDIIAAFATVLGEEYEIEMDI